MLAGTIQSHAGVASSTASSKSGSPPGTAICNGLVDSLPGPNNPSASSDGIKAFSSSGSDIFPGNSLSGAGTNTETASTPCAPRAEVPGFNSSSNTMPCPAVVTYELPEEMDKAETLPERAQGIASTSWDDEPQLFPVRLLALLALNSLQWHACII